MQTAINEINAKVEEVIALAEEKFGKMPPISVRFDLKGKAAGQAQCRNNMFSGPSNLAMRFNRTHIALGGQTLRHIIEDVVAHEIAHLVCYVNPHLGRNHDRGWKMVCRALGGNGERCYTTEDAPEAVAKQSPYVYMTSNGYEVRLSKRVHNKVQMGASYRFKGGKGSVTKHSEYRYADTVVELATPSKAGTAPAIKPPVKKAAPAKRVVKRSAGTSNADMIRAKIRTGASVEECVEYGVSVLGMKRQLARTYVKNNWNKA